MLLLSFAQHCLPFVSWLYNACGYNRAGTEGIRPDFYADKKE